MFKAGQSGNPSGRPQGAKDKTSTEWREIITKAWNETADIADLINEVQKKDPGRATELKLKMLPYLLPQLKAVEHSAHEGDVKIKFSFTSSDKE